MKPGPAQVAKACSTAALASSRLLKKLMGCGVALGMWAGGCHRRSPIQVAVHPPMSLPLRMQTGCPFRFATQLVGGCGV